MTKHKSLSLLVVLVALAQGAMAQGGSTAYPRYGFWSNWKVGGEIIYNHQYSNGGFFDFGHATDLGLGLVGEKELSYLWDFRLQVAWPGFFSKESNAVGGTFFDRYGKYTANFKLSLNDLFMGYDPQRRFSVYALLGGGVASNFRVADFGYWSVMAQGGFGCSYDFGKHGSVYAEYVVDNIANIPDFGHLHDLHGALSVGLLYRFGPTSADSRRIAREAELTQGNLDALKHRVDALEQELASAMVDEKEETETDAAINGYDGGKQSLRALPFSVFFDNDSYVIAADQMEVIEAVAKLMWNNPEMRLDVVGYCSYTNSEDYNQELTDHRAEAVKNELVRLGVNESRLVASGKGHSLDIGDSKSGINRRVSFFRIVD